MATAYKITPERLLDNMVALGRDGFYSVKEVLTPQLAAALLDRNPSNRSLSQSRVDLYAADIIAGRWTFNGEPVIVSKEGWLTDGQHRCAAVVQTGIPIETAMSFGVTYESRTTTNQLRPKTAGDYAGMSGVSNAMGVAAIAKMAIAYERDGVIDGRGITQGAILEYVSANQTALERSASIAHSRSEKMKNIVSPSVLGFCHYVTARINQGDADRYAEKIITGENMAANDPAMVARNRLIAIGKSPRSVKVEIILHGWNAYRRGLTRVQARSTGKLPSLV